MLCHPGQHPDVHAGGGPQVSLLHGSGAAGAAVSGDDRAGRRSVHVDCRDRSHQHDDGPPCSTPVLIQDLPPYEVVCGTMGTTPGGEYCEYDPPAEYTPSVCTPYTTYQWDCTYDYTIVTNNYSCPSPTPQYLRKHAGRSRLHRACGADADFRCARCQRLLDPRPLCDL